MNDAAQHGGLDPTRDTDAVQMKCYDPKGSKKAARYQITPSGQKQIQPLLRRLTRLTRRANVRYSESVTDEQTQLEPPIHVGDEPKGREVYRKVRISAATSKRFSGLTHIFSHFFLSKL